MSNPKLRGIAMPRPPCIKRQTPTRDHIAHPLETNTTKELAAILPVTVKEIGDATVGTINARQLHRALNVGNDFSTWIKEQIKRARLLGDRDFEVFMENHENLKGGRPCIEYRLTTNAATHVVLISGTEKGYQIREYFIACEKALREQDEAKQSGNNGDWVRPSEAALRLSLVPRSVHNRVKYLPTTAVRQGAQGREVLFGVMVAHLKANPIKTQPYQLVRGYNPTGGSKLAKVRGNSPVRTRDGKPTITVGALVELLKRVHVVADTGGDVT